MAAVLYTELVSLTACRHVPDFVGIVHLIPARCTHQPVAALRMSSSLLTVHVAARLQLSCRSSDRQQGLMFIFGAPYDATLNDLLTQ